MHIKEIIQVLENLAAPALQESYDNSRLIVGDASIDCSGILIALDVTEQIVDEAKEKNCNFIVCHHPILFKGIKKLTGSNYVERTIIRAIKNDIALYAIHTNLDNAMNGVSFRIAEKIGLKNTKILQPKTGMLKHLVTFGPRTHTEKIKNALFAAGAGNIGQYSKCSFVNNGTGSFKPDSSSDPFIGEKNTQNREEEDRIEVIFPSFLADKVLKSLKDHHPYEEVAVYITTLDNKWQDAGSGVVGELLDEMPEQDFFKLIKEKFNLKVIRHSALLNKPIKKVALCGGSGFFLLKDAIGSGADIYLTADIKYHEFFDADGQILLADMGHYESEQYTVELLAEFLQNKYPNFAVQKTALSTNSVHYFL